MTRILAAMLWPAGAAVIACIGAFAAARVPRGAAAFGSGGPQARPAGRHGPTAAADRYGPTAAADPAPDLPVRAKVVRFALVLVAGTATLYTLMVLLGLLVTNVGPRVDKPVFRWTVAHRIHPWYSLMLRATEIGDKYPVWAAAVIAAVCLAVAWRRDRWIPPAALCALIVVDHFLTLAINHTVTRTPPPGAGGIFPSGGTDRAVDYYGLIAYLLWREFSGQRRSAIWAGAIVAALGFTEGYTRGYLAVHWFTDVLSGFLYGCLILGMMIAAVQLAAGPPQVADAGEAHDLAARPAPAPAPGITA